MRHLSRALQILLSATLFYASYWALRLAYADHLYRQNTPASLRRAAELAPFDENYQAALGNWERAVELNRNFSVGWLELAFRAERDGKIPEAERLLLRAEEVDKQFEPRWALANFYVRQNRTADFWKWIRLAAERSYGDRRGIFSLCDRMAGTSKEVLEKGLPPDAQLISEYVAHLTRRDRLVDAAEAAQRLRDTCTAQQAEALIDLCDRLIQSGDGAQASEVWNVLSGRGLAPVRNPLANGELRTAPLGRGFDWKLGWRVGIFVRWSPGIIRAALNGKQEESTELLSQWVWLPDPGAYQLSCRQRTVGLGEKTGLAWKVEGAARVEPVEDGVRFRVSKPALVRLVFGYGRIPGTMRAEGEIYLDGPVRLVRSGLE